METWSARIFAQVGGSTTPTSRCSLKYSIMDKGEPIWKMSMELIFDNDGFEEKLDVFLWTSKPSQLYSTQAIVRKGTLINILACIKWTDVPNPKSTKVEKIHAQNLECQIEAFYIYPHKWLKLQIWMPACVLQKHIIKRNYGWMCILRPHP